LETTTEVGQNPRALAAAAGSVWVGSRRDVGIVYRVDAADAVVLDSIIVGAIPSALAAAEGGVWVAVT
jgi:hypothetical protein